MGRDEHGDNSNTNSPYFGRIVDMLISAMKRAEGNERSWPGKTSGCSGDVKTQQQNPNNFGPTQPPGVDEYFGFGDSFDVEGQRCVEVQDDVDDKKKFLCTVPGCSYRTKRRDALKPHLANVHGIGFKLTYCKQPGCDFKVKQRGRLKQHLAVVHGIGIELHYCGQQSCQYRSKNKGDLKRHLANVHDVGKKKMYVCPQVGCLFKANQRSHLKQHAFSIHQIIINNHEIKDVS